MPTHEVLRYINVVRSQFLYQAVSIFLIVAIVIPALVYYAVIDLRKCPAEELSTCVVEYDYRIPCGFTPGRRMGNLSIYNCRKANCCFDDFTKTCFHYLPSKFGYYIDKNGGMPPYKTKKELTPLRTPMHKHVSIKVTATKDYLEASLQKTQISKISANGNVRESSTVFPGVAYNLSDKDLTFDVYRTDYANDLILTTSLGPLIASDSYWEWSVHLTNKDGVVYGLGGLEISGKVSRVIHRNEADQSNVPFFLAQHQTPKGVRYHALLVQHKGALEVEVLESKVIILRALNSTGISLRLFPGPTLEDVRNQHIGAGVVPDVVPRWLLGTHICRSRVTDFATMVQEFLNEQQIDSFNADSDCFNELLVILLMEMYDNPTLWGNKDHLRDNAKNMKTMFVLPLTPHIPIGVKATDTDPEREYSFYTKAAEMNVLLRNSSGSIQQGVYKNRNVAFLDPTAARVGEYLKLLLDLVGKVFPLSRIVGVFLLDNWPQDDSSVFNPEEENYPYYNKDITSALVRTPAILLTDQATYVKKQLEVVRRIVSAVIGKDIPVLSAAHYYGYGTPLLPQYVPKTWASMKALTTRTLFANMFTHPVSLTPVCGTNAWLNATAYENELCARWFVNQATLPGQRITVNWYTHTNFTRASRGIVRKALELKKMLSYYQYTLHKMHGQIVKPMFWDFPNDNDTWSLDEQYLLGDLLVVPILLPQATLRRFYLPVSHTWYEFWGGMNFQNGWQTLSVSRDERLLFLKEGSVVPIVRQIASSEMTFELIVGKQCLVGRQSNRGSIYFEEHTLQTEVLDHAFEITNIGNVQTDINCAGAVKNHPFVISKLKIFDCKQGVISYEINFDICASKRDSERLLLRDYSKKR